MSLHHELNGWQNFTNEEKHICNDIISLSLNDA